MCTHSNCLFAVSFEDSVGVRCLEKRSTLGEFNLISRQNENWSWKCISLHLKGRPVINILELQPTPPNSENSFKPWIQGRDYALETICLLSAKKNLLTQVRDWLWVLGIAYLPPQATKWNAFHLLQNAFTISFLKTSFFSSLTGGLGTRYSPKASPY